MPAQHFGQRRAGGLDGGLFPLFVFQRLQVVFIALQHRLAVHPQSRRVYFDEVSRVNRDGKQMKLAVFHGLQIDHTDPRALKHLLQGQS